MKIFTTALAGIAAMTSLSSFAQFNNTDEVAKNGFYVGGNYGYLRVDGDDEFDDDKDVWQGLVGYRFNPYFSLEGSYIDFGDYGNGLAEASTDGYTAAIKGSYPITGTVSLYAKLGQLWSETDYRFDTVNGDSDDESLFLGGGLRYAFNSRLSINAEYTVYDTTLDAENVAEDFDDTNFDTDLKQASVGFEYRF